MRGDVREALRHAGDMIFCAEYGLPFAKEGNHWRCVEYPGALLLSGSERYRVRERTFGSLNDALRHLKARDTIQSATVAP